MPLESKSNSILPRISLTCRSQNTAPQAQKILKRLGLKELNNLTFLKGNSETIRDLHQVKDYIAYGYPKKALVDKILRKRGFLKKDNKKVAISDNVLIEELMGPLGIICIEDIIDCFYNCAEDGSSFADAVKFLWPIQLAELKDTLSSGSVVNEATKKTLKKSTTKVKKGGYIGNMGDKINEFIENLI